MIALGQFFFRWRNLLFPVLFLTFFALLPPAQTAFGSVAGERTLHWLGLFALLAGLTVRFVVIGFIPVARDGKDKTAHADELYTGALFATSRNPLYVGNMLNALAITLLHGNIWIIVIGNLLFYLIYSAIIASEEAYLKGKFGGAYEAYCKDVPRWLPRLDRIGPAFSQMRFSFARGLAIEHSVIMTMTIFSGLALWFEARVAMPPSSTFWLFGIALVAGALGIWQVQRQKAS